MTKRQLKTKAQHRLMTAMQTAFGDALRETDDRMVPAAVRDEMDLQFARVEKLLGYVQGSWRRDC